MTAREARKERLESAAERLGELEQALDETRLALQQQLAENADISRQLQEQKALAQSKQAKQAEQKTLFDAITQAVRTLEGMN